MPHDAHVSHPHTHKKTEQGGDPGPEVPTHAEPPQDTPVYNVSEDDIPPDMYDYDLPSEDEV